MDHSGMSEKIGELIASRLRAMKKQQEWLAENVGVSVNAVSKWTKTGKISRGNVARVAKLLELSADELLGGESREPVRHSAGSRLERLDIEEAELIEIYRECGAGERELILNHAKLLAGGKVQPGLFITRNKS